MTKVRLRAAQLTAFDGRLTRFYKASDRVGKGEGVTSVRRARYNSRIVAFGRRRMIATCFKSGARFKLYNEITFKPNTTNDF